MKATRAIGGVNMMLTAGTTDELFWRDPFTTQFQNQARNMKDKIVAMRLAGGRRSRDGGEESRARAS